ncbi:sensor histidine kinase [Pseudoflavitalea sp. X16]|uniref:sensor histidine kinase n=1 Tax=Paraflavitalea devenefica TaxID=2716334 RepID=UPI00141E68E2|nr:sensor histidine kinase [Paraflavitalea devenefica]NII26411.1 sensor histidine kinase [Paraflavitalea devenefica]
MFKVVVAYILFSLLMSLHGLSQPSPPSAIPGYTYHPPHEDKLSWQRLNLWLSSTFLVIVKEGQADADSCLYAASRSLGISRFSLLAEGFDDPDLFGQSTWIDRRDPGKGVRLLSAANGRKHLQLLLLLGAYYAFEPHSYDRHRDSVEYFLTRALHESKSLKEERLGRQALCLLGKVYIQGNDKRGDSLSDALINECKRAGDQETVARILAYRGIYKPPTPSTLEKKVLDLQEAAALYQSTGNAEGAINVLTDLGYLQIITGQLPAGYESHLKAYKLAEAIHYPYTHYSTQALASATIYQGKFGEPLRYVYQTIKTAEITRDSLAWGYFYTSLALLLNSEGRTKESAEMAQQSVKRFVADRNTSVYNILNDVVGYMGEEGRAKEALALTQDIANKVGFPDNFSEQFFYHFVFSNCYLNLGMADQAELHIKKLDSLEAKAAVFRGPVRQSAINAQFAHLFVLRKQYQKARAYFERQITSPSLDEGVLPNKLVTYRWLIFIDSALGDHAAAVSHYKSYTQLLDSNFKVTKIRQAEELQVTYQMNEKENQIKSLTQEAKLEKANSEKAALVRNLTIAGILAVLIIAGLLYRQNRLKQRSNQVITGKNEQLQQLLSDKEWLLREIHHRVKNNLQIVLSLLDSQSEYINNDAALAAIEDNMRRVHAMALIHQKLYQSDDISTISMPEYVHELVSYARDSFDTGNRISFEQAIEPLDLDVSQAIPLGLIINEVIVNAIKYAFPDGRKGVVRIRFYQDGADHLVLQIADNGVGLPAGLNTKASTSLGLDLMKGLARQLNGSFGFENNNGLHITIRFTVLRHHFSHPSLTNS